MLRHTWNDFSSFFYESQVLRNGFAKCNFIWASETESRMGMAQHLRVRNSEMLMRRQRTLEGLRVEDMQASRPEDVEEILSKIPDKAAFNKSLQELIFDPDVGLLVNWRQADALQKMDFASHVLKWARFSETVDDGTLIWRRWMA